MHKKKYKHSKFRNTGLLFEFLLRQVTADTLNNKRSEALKIIKKNFNENTELGKELGLYNSFIKNKFNSDKKSNYFISEVINARTKLNNTRLKREKYNLIKEIKSKYNLSDMLSCKVENYRVYASVYKLFEFNNKLSPYEKTETFFNISEFLLTENKNSIKLSEIASNSMSSDDKDMATLTYKILLEKFNNKYVKLDSNQKLLLKEYINNVSNIYSLKEFIQSKIPRIEKDLKKYYKYVNEKVVKIKLKEAIHSIGKFLSVDGKSKSVNDTAVLQMMRYYELLKELKNHARKSKKLN